MGHSATVESMIELTPETSVEDIQIHVNQWIDDHWELTLTVGEWWQKMLDAGLSHPMLPVNAYGQGWSRAQAMAVGKVLAERNVLGPPPGLGSMLAAPTIAEHGTQAQIDRYIPAILNGTEAWCQLFSEPNAGSDLASMAARAERDGDEWRVTGQKVWTSGGQTADMGMLVARTDPNQPKHRGLTYFAIDMHQDQVDIRPLIEMTGHAFFNEVFMEDAITSEDARIGDLGNGWRVANTTLMHERASIGAGGSGAPLAAAGSIANQLGREVGEFVTRKADGKSARRAMPGVGMRDWERLAETSRKLGMESDPNVRQRMTRLYSNISVNRWNTQRARQKSQRTGGEPNIAKLHDSALHHEFREVGLSIVGAEGMLAVEGQMTNPSVGAMTLFSPGPSIYGGTNEIQKNIIGERVLGLPKEPGPDKNTPFSELAKNQ